MISSTLNAEKKAKCIKFKAELLRIKQVAQNEQDKIEEEVLSIAKIDEENADNIVRYKYLTKKAIVKNAAINEVKKLGEAILLIDYDISLVDLKIKELDAKIKEDKK